MFLYWISDPTLILPVLFLNSLRVRRKGKEPMIKVSMDLYLLATPASQTVSELSSLKQELFLIFAKHVDWWDPATGMAKCGSSPPCAYLHTVRREPATVNSHESFPSTFPPYSSAGLTPESCSTSD